MFNKIVHIMGGWLSKGVIFMFNLAAVGSVKKVAKLFYYYYYY